MLYKRLVKYYRLFLWWVWWEKDCIRARILRSYTLIKLRIFLFVKRSLYGKKGIAVDMVFYNPKYHNATVVCHTSGFIDCTFHCNNSHYGIRFVDENGEPFDNSMTISLPKDKEVPNAG